MVIIEKKYDVYRLLADEDSEPYKKGDTILVLDTLEECLTFINGSEYEFIDEDKDIFKNKAVEIIKEKFNFKSYLESGRMIQEAKSLGLITENEEEYLTIYYKLAEVEGKLNRK